MNRLLTVVLSIGIVVAFWSYLQYLDQLAESRLFVDDANAIAESFEVHDRLAENSRSLFVQGESTPWNEERLLDEFFPGDRESLVGWDRELRILQAEPVTSKPRPNSKTNRGAAEGPSHSLVAAEFGLSRSNASMSELGELIHQLENQSPRMPLNEILLLSNPSDASGSGHWNCQIFGSLFVERSSLQDSK